MGPDVCRNLFTCLIDGCDAIAAEFSVFSISFNLLAINFCWTSVYFLNMCRENEPIKEMLTTAVEP